MRKLFSILIVTFLFSSCTYKDLTDYVERLKVNPNAYDAYILAFSFFAVMVGLVAVLFYQYIKMNNIKNAIQKEYDFLDKLLPTVKGNRKGKNHRSMQLGYWKKCTVNARAAMERLKEYL